MKSELNLNNLKKLRDIYAEAIETGDVAHGLQLGLCFAYETFIGEKDMYEVEELYPKKYQDDIFMWPVISHNYHNASIDEALVPRYSWLQDKINEMEATND